MEGIFNKTFFRFFLRFVMLIAVGLIGAFTASFWSSSSEGDTREAPQAYVGEEVKQ